MSVIDRPAGAWAARACVLGLFLLAVATAAGAKTRYVGIKPASHRGTTCLAVKGQEHAYYSLDRDDPVVLKVRGPRRVKIAARYCFGADDPAQQRFALRVTLDGNQALYKSFGASTLAGAARCGGQGGEVSALKRAYVDVPTGLHEILVFAEAAGDGRAAARFYRESRKQQARDVIFAPEGYDAVYNLQFASGRQSTYYHFTGQQPLRFTLRGPTNVTLFTRLDFTSAMNGSQNYSLEVLCDGAPLNTFHYQATKISGASYVERPDILAGDRKPLRISVPRGDHRYVIRCVRPSACGVAAQIRIPEADINPR